MTVVRAVRLHVDLATGRIERSQRDLEATARFIGGRGTNIAHLYEHLTPQTDPLSPEAPVLLGAGPFSGTGLPGGSRFNISARSPQTGILGDSNAGGFFGPHLRFAGVDELLITGAASDPVLIWIDDDRIELRDAHGLWGLDTSAATSAIEDLLGGRGIQVAVVGPAAENGVAFAGVFANRVRAAARTGLGTVLAAKGVKAIAVRGTQGVTLADPRRLRAGADDLRQRLLAHPEYELRARLGTTQLVTKLQALGALPTRHFRSGTFEHARAVSGETIATKYKVRGAACFACPIPCSRLIAVDDPRFPGLSFEGPEYEPLAGFTARVGNPDLPLALYAIDRCNRLGLDAISTSEVIAWAMECGELGLISRNEADGLELSFGCGETILTLIESIATRQGFGDVLADGVRTAAKRLHRGEAIAMHVKGLELFQADVRAMKAYALGNAVASRGADHLRSEPWFELSGDRDEGTRRYGIPETADRLAWRGKGLVVKDFEERAAVADALGICKNIYNNMEALSWEETAELLQAATGAPWTGDELRRSGERIVNAERLLNVRFGITGQDDTLPQRFLVEPAGPPDSPSAGSVVELDAMLAEYYAARGWDKTSGLPTASTCRDLGLEESDA
jgi:aldehyde:ferredoxin oxidoreductase